jgi:hypothetical protein
LKHRFTQVEESLLAGLLIGWSPGWLKQSPQPHYVTLQTVLGEARRRKQSAVQPTALPQMYLKSLENDSTVCRAAARRRSESKDSTEALEGVVDDLNLKFRDCYLHGMGRFVSMSVATKKDTAPDAGWTVYFKWVTVRRYTDNRKRISHDEHSGKPRSASGYLSASCSEEGSDLRRDVGVGHEDCVSGWRKQQL